MRQRYLLTEQEFDLVATTLNITDQSREIAHGVLVKGIKQQAYVDKFKITPAAVSYLVKRFREAYDQYSLPEGYAIIPKGTILPEDKAFYVMKNALTIEEIRKKERNGK